MSDRFWRRLVASSGILYVVLVLSHGDTGSPLGFGASSSAIVHWIDSTAAHGVNWFEFYTEGLGQLSLLVFVAFLATVLRSREGSHPWLSTVVLSAGLLALAVHFASFASVWTLEYRAHEGVDSHLAAAALFDSADILYLLTWPLIGLSIAAAAVAVLRYRALPTWLGLVGLAVAVVQFAAVPLSFGPGQVMNLASLLWVALASGTLVIRPDMSDDVVAVGELAPAAS